MAAVLRFRRVLPIALFLVAVLVAAAFARTVPGPRPSVATPRRDGRTVRLAFQTDSRVDSKKDKDAPPIKDKDGPGAGWVFRIELI